MEKEFEKEFVTYELALRMKQLGFDEPCFGYFTSPKELIIQQPKDKNGVYVYFAPTFSQAFRWFREKYSLLLDVVMFYDENQLPLTYKNLQKPKGYFVWNYYDENFSEEKAVKLETYEEAELECLKKLIELVGNEKML
jgi:hypothetical protein